MNKHYTHILTLITFAFLSCTAFAQSNVRWSIECQREVYDHATFEVSFTLTNAEGKNVKFPSFDGFDLLSGPSTSQSLSIVNGARSSATSFSFVFQARNPGSYVIGSATIEANGKLWKTEPYNLTVIKSNLKSSDVPSGDIAAIAKMKVSPTRAYVGQQIMAEYIIYYGENIGMSEAPLKPNFEGFFIKDLNVAQVATSGVRVGNRQFEGILVDAVALYPQKAGLFKIDPTNYKIQKRIRSGNPFQNPFGDYVQRNIMTNGENIDVKALPSGAPQTFSGGVGTYKIESFIDKNAYTTNQSISLKLTVEGNGDSRQVGPPTQNFGSDFEVFPARLVSDEEYIEANVVWHKKTFEYLITPKKEGTFTLNPVFTYFDTKSETYKTLDSKTASFSVKKESKSISSFFSGEQAQASNNGSGYLWALLLLLPILGSFTYWWLKVKNKNIVPLSEEEKLVIKKNNAAKIALAQLSKAQQLMDHHQYDLFYKEIGFAINGYLQSKFNITTENLNKEYIHLFLSQRANAQAIATDYKEILEKAEMSMYAGFSDKNVHNIFDRSKNFIANCEME
jgi:BatD DUF11 like domain